MLAQRIGQFNRSAFDGWSNLWSGSALIFFADLLMVPTGLATVALLTRWLGPEGYGMFALAASLIAGVEWGLASILSRPTIHGLSHASDWRPVARTVLGWHLALAVAVLAVLWILSRPLAELLREPALFTYLALFACDLPFFLLAQAYRNILTGRGQFAARAVTGASRWLARLVLIVLAVEIGLSISAAIMASIGASLVELAIGRWAVGPVGSAGASDGAMLKRIALPLVVSAASIMLISKMDLFLIKILGMPVEQAGLYAAAQNLAILPGILGQAVSAVLLSTLTRTKVEGRMAAFRQAAEQSLQVVLCLLPPVAMVAGAASGIALLCFGPAFQEAAPFVSVLMVGAMAQVFMGMLMAVLTANGDWHWTAAIGSALLLLALGGHLWSIPTWGSAGAAAVTSGTMLVGGVFAYVVAQSLRLVRLRIQSLGRALFLGALGWGLATIAPAGPVWLLLGLPSAAIILVASYGWWEGLIGYPSPFSIRHMSEERTEESL
ncbi:MAG: lipopolysaccharide biosynthesis protein [Nitrospira sp.]